jgi:uncharacterized membrane protein YkvA (DUF1232 family)
MENLGQYSKFYSNESFWTKLKGFAGKAGVKVVYLALLLYYMLVDEAIDLKSKVTIAAGLGYFVLPFDLIPDFAPIIRFTDDLSVLIFTYSIVKTKINETHRIKARTTLQQWFRDVDEAQLLAFENGNGK